MKRVKSKSKALNKPRAIDLFSGCGGLTLGLKKAGFEVVAAVEIEKHAAEVYKKNHKNTDLLVTDIREIKPKKLMKEIGIAAGELDLLAGCPPCQGFSSLRTRNGASRNRDKRNSLVMEMIRFVKEFKPKAVMLENVPKLATYRTFNEFRNELELLGYSVVFAIKNAADYGIPQRRKRLIMLAGMGFVPSMNEGKKNSRSVRDAIGNLSKANTTNDLLHRSDMTGRSSRIMDLIRHIPKDGGSRSSLPKRLQLKCHKSRKGFNDVYGRMAWDDVSPTITGGCYNPSKGRFLHPQHDRPITLREAAILQGFPKGYHFSHTASLQKTALMIGNALPPGFVAAHAKSIMLDMKK